QSLSRSRPCDCASGRGTCSSRTAAARVWLCCVYAAARGADLAFRPAGSLNHRPLGVGIIRLGAVDPGCLPDRPNPMAGLATEASVLKAVQSIVALDGRLGGRP